jgi:hypothetical protein
MVRLRRQAVWPILLCCAGLAVGVGAALKNRQPDEAPPPAPLPELEPPPLPVVIAGTGPAPAPQPGGRGPDFLIVAAGPESPGPTAGGSPAGSELDEAEIWRLVTQQFEDWRYVRGAGGGQVESDLGRRYAALLREAAAREGGDPITQHDQAVKALAAEVDASNDPLAARRFVPGRSDFRLYPNLRSLRVAVVTPGSLDSRIADHVLRKNGRFGPPEGPPEVVLVSVSTPSGSSPLGREYGSLDDLKRAVERQPSLPGGYTHVYVYSVEPDGSLARVFYASAEAEQVDLQLRR